MLLVRCRRRQQRPRCLLLINSWLIFFCVSSMQIASGCSLFGAATDQPDHPDGPWGPIVKTGYQIDMYQEDGSVLKGDCDESETIRQAIVDGKAPNGVWLGGQKYQLIEVVSVFRLHSHVCLYTAVRRGVQGISRAHKPSFYSFRTRSSRVYYGGFTFLMPLRCCFFLCCPYFVCVRSANSTTTVSCTISRSSARTREAAF